MGFSESREAPSCSPSRATYKGIFVSRIQPNTGMGQLRLGAALALGCLALVICTQSIVASEPHGDVIRASRVEIVNAEGKTVIRLEAGSKGDGQIVLLSPAGDVVLQLPQGKSASAKAAPVGGGDGWRDKANWRKLKRGMSKEDVKILLGDPAKITEVADQSWWYYGSVPMAKVEFGPGGVIGWAEP